ncbi:MAG TPA: FecR domain-containing protein [Sphingobacteriaceae bacterium]
MDENQLGFIYKKFLQGNCSAEEIEFLYDHFNAEYEEELKQLILYELELKEDHLVASEREHQVLANVYSRVKRVTHPQNSETVLPKPLHKILFYRIAAAAILVICLSIGIRLYFQQPVMPSDNIVKNNPGGDVAPGGNKASLILDDGTRISLEDVSTGQIARESGIVITKSADGQLVYTVSDNSKNEQNVAFNTIETPNGGQYQVILPDGTRVWLNAASSLKYPTSFTGNERKVELNGEGYFEVAKNIDKPFRVSTLSQDVEVLGTHFNVNSYADEDDVKTTLLEGSIKVSSRSTGKSRILLPGQQSVFSGDELIIKDVFADDAIAWKDGYFQFNQADLKTVMKELARWYNVTIRYEGNIRSQRFGGAIQRNLHLSQALKILEKSQVHFRIEGKEVIVMP